jgi:phosphoribosylformylglycinamidine cyclo-ligase
MLTPTRIYVKPILQLIAALPVKALAHITGGGLTENIPRVIPAGLDAVIDTRTWRLPPVFGWLMDKGNIAWEEMYRTFNCGVGMVACVEKKDQAAALACLARAGETVWVIGAIEGNDTHDSRVKFVS